jgi:hypothetical protein
MLRLMSNWIAASINVGREVSGDQSSSPGGATIVSSFDVLKHVLERQIFRLAAMSNAEATFS